jgi:uncharacterized protein YceK
MRSLILLVALLLSGCGTILSKPEGFTACQLADTTTGANVGTLTNCPHTGAALQKVAALTPITFRMKGINADWNYAQPQVGLAAEQVAEVVKECAIYEQDGVTPKSYRQECLIALTIKATQELEARVRRLEPSGGNMLDVPAVNEAVYRRAVNF